MHLLSVISVYLVK